MTDNLFQQIIGGTKTDDVGGNNTYKYENRKVNTISPSQNPQFLSKFIEPDGPDGGDRVKISQYQTVKF